MRKFLPLIASFLGFAICIAARDVSYRWIFQQGVTPGTVMFLSGAASFLTSIIFSLFSKHSFKINKPKVQLWRLAITCCAGYAVIKSFFYVSPSHIAILSKAALPILILIGSFFGHSFVSREKIMATLVLEALAFFALILPSGELSLIGFIILSLSIAFTLIEFLFLAAAVKNESPFYMSATPSLGLILAGIASGCDFDSLKLLTIIVLALSGILFFLAYLTSSIRYKILPPGLAEFPSLMTYFFILPLEILVYDKKPSPYVFAAATFTLCLMSILVVMRARTKKV